MKHLGVDFGKSKTGLAISDELGLVARPFQILHIKNQQKLVDTIVDIIQQNKIEMVVVGLPLSWDEEKSVPKDSEQTRTVRAFTNDLRRRISEEISAQIPIDYWDESFSSAIAGQKFAKKPEDSEAAKIVLQEYLDQTELNPT